MTPYAQARALCLSLGGDWSEWLDAAQFIWSSPTAFVMARELTEADGYEGGGWMIDLAVGDMAEFFRVEPPGQKKWVAFRRGDSQSVHSYERIKRLCCHGTDHPHSHSRHLDPLCSGKRVGGRPKGEPGSAVI